ncbi:MAG: amidohydrolase family protein, partial [Candidatus Hydrothermae bacterium]|nr:amidohydrolase family protein [Candidatus Hydrothermae bacterium]
MIQPLDHYCLQATLLDTPERGTLRVLENGALRVEGGKIVERTASPPEQTDLPVLDLRPFWVIPGLMDLHTHPPQSRVRGRAGLGLLEWLQTYVFPEEQRFEDEGYARARFREVFREALRAGTTFLVGFMTVHVPALQVALEEAEAAGIRVLLGLTLMDDAPGSGLEQDPEAQLRTLDPLIPAWHGREDRFFLSLAPRFALACTEACMRRAAEFARSHGLWIQTHLSETLPEVREALRRFPWAHTY